MDCIGDKDPRYDTARRISNARFDLKPASICYPSTEAGVQQLVRSGQRGKVRVRSGGHNHEGMCSGDGVTIIDVSKLNCINIRNNVLTVGPGARLGSIYDALWETRTLLPGGGCADVCVGGLAQGGGWGPYSRRLGLTCDQLIGFRMVKADGTIVDANKSDSRPPDLFWAVAGGGGGNFGVITEFRFQLLPLGDTPITSFTVSWSDRSLYAPVIADWRSNFPFDGDTNLTSFCRLTKLAGGASLEQPVVVAGNYLGDVAPCEQALTRLLPATWARKTDVSFDRVDKKALGREVFHHPEYQPGPPAEAVRALAVAADVRSDLGSTCAGYPFPHKVSSCYPGNNFDQAVPSIANYLSAEGTEPTARRYLSLHGFGGAIRTANPRSCFAYREMPFLLQYQAWWANKDQKDVEERCIQWVRTFRLGLKDYTVGSFINFPDRELPVDAYYGGSFADLKNVKRANDPNNLFEFPMGIPTS